MRLALQQHQYAVHQQRQRHQHDAQRDALGEFALAGLERDRGGDGAGLALDIPAHHQRAAHFRNHSPEAADHGRHHPITRLVQHGEHHAHTRGAVGERGLGIARVERLHRRQGEGQQHRQADDELPEHDARLREQPFESTQRSASRQHQVEQQADQDRRQRQRGLSQPDRDTPSRKAVHRDQVAEQHRRRRGQHQAQQAGLDRDPDDMPQGRIAAEQQREGVRGGVQQRHLVARSAVRAQVRANVRRVQ